MPEWIGELVWMLYLLGCGACFGFVFIRNKCEIFPKGTEERISATIKLAFFEGMEMLSREISIKVTRDHMQQSWVWSEAESYYRSIRRRFQ